MTANWQLIGERLEAMLRDCASTLPAPVQWDVGHGSNEPFPLRVYLSFSRTGGRGSEDLVISADVWADAGALVLSADIARGDGLVLAEVPSQRLQAGDDVTPQVLDWVDRVTSFVAANRGLLAAELSA
jgi:hypothetical protein